MTERVLLECPQCPGLVSCSKCDTWRTSISELDVFAARDLAVEAARETEAIRDRLIAEIAYKRQHPWRRRWVTVRKWVGKR